MTAQQKQEFYAYLSQFITENKRQKFEEVLQNRTRFITVVLEDIFQPHNASAVLRSCDSFGIQDVHIIENENTYELNPDVEVGSAKWLTLKKYNHKESNTLDCMQHLKSQGYKIIATSPRKNDCSLHELKLDGKIALMFGKEKEGLSETALQNADGFMKIPMYGFVESLNISVSAAISLQHLSRQLRLSKLNWQLTEEEKLDLRLTWAKKVLGKANLYENEFLCKLK